MQPADVTYQKYVDYLVAISCMVADVYVEGTLNDVFAEGVHTSIRHSLRLYWAQNPQADLSNIVF